MEEVVKGINREIARHWRSREGWTVASLRFDTELQVVECRNAGLGLTAQVTVDSGLGISSTFVSSLFDRLDELDLDGSLKLKLKRDDLAKQDDADAMIALFHAHPNNPKLDWLRYTVGCFSREPRSRVTNALMGTVPNVYKERATELLIEACRHGEMDVADKAARHVSSVDLATYGTVRTTARSWRMRGLVLEADRIDTALGIPVSFPPP